MLMMSTNSGQAAYRIREVDGNDDDIADALAELHQFTFLDAAPVPQFERTLVVCLDLPLSISTRWS